MSLLSLKTAVKSAVLAAAATTAFMAPSAQAHYRHHGYYGHPHVVHYSYRPVYVKRYHYQKCAKYGWVWIKGEKCWACVKYW